MTNVIYDPRWIRAFDDSAVWPLVPRTALEVEIAGNSRGTIVQLAVLLRIALRAHGPSPDPRPPDHRCAHSQR